MNKLSFVSAVLALALLSGAVHAAPGIPNQIWGTVTYNGAPAPDGMSVTAKINGVDVASTTASGGTYALIVADPNQNRAGKTIALFVKGISTGMETAFCTGCVTEMNLAVTESVSSPPASSPPSGGGSGGGGGSAPATQNTVTPPQNNTAASGGVQVTSAESAQCIEKWTCSEWGTCDNGVKRRDCNDLNKCGTNINEPFESQPCTIEERETAQSTPTGFSFLTSTYSLAGLLLLILLAAGALLKGKLFFRGS